MLLLTVRTLLLLLLPILATLLLLAALPALLLLLVLALLILLLLIRVLLVCHDESSLLEVSRPRMTKLIRTDSIRRVTKCSSSCRNLDSIVYVNLGVVNRHIFLCAPRKACAAANNANYDNSTKNVFDDMAR